MRCHYGQYSAATGNDVRCDATAVPGQMFCLYHLRSDLDENGEPYDEG